MNRAEREYLLYQSYSISANKEFYKNFLKSTFEIESLAEAQLIDVSLRGSLDRLLYSNVISSLETYLSDALINLVMADSARIRLVVETVPEFKSQKIDLSEIYSKFETMDSLVHEYLVGLIYHNISKVQKIYSSVLGVNFPSDCSDLYVAIQKRHDIVHRNGKNKNGEPLEIAKEDVLNLVTISRKFVDFINVQLPVMST